MLDFRVLIGALVFGLAFMAAVLVFFDDRDVSIAALPRPGVETAAAPRMAPPPPTAPSDVILIRAPIIPLEMWEKRPTAEVRPRAAARKKEAEEPVANPFQRFFLLFERKAN